MTRLVLAALVLALVLALVITSGCARMGFDAPYEDEATETLAADGILASAGTGISDAGDLGIGDAGDLGIGDTSDHNDLGSDIDHRPLPEAGQLDSAPTLDLAPDLSPDSTPDQAVAYSYVWKTGAWSGCSAPCDGGTQTRVVWCQRDDGTRVGDAFCDGAKPAATQQCNTQPCYTTDALQAGYRCDGSARVQWTHWGSDTASSSDRRSCAAQCTAWARTQLDRWCCQLYEDSSSGINWVCRVYDAYSMHASSSAPRYSGLGRSQLR